MLRSSLIKFFICCLGFWSVIWCLLKFFWVFFWFVGVWFGLVAVCCFESLVELLLGKVYSPLIYSVNVGFACWGRVCSPRGTGDFSSVCVVSQLLFAQLQASWCRLHADNIGKGIFFAVSA